MGRRIGVGTLVLGAVAALTVTSAGSATPAPTPGITYVKTGRALPSVWIAAADGSQQRRLGSGDQALLSPDGTLVAADRASGLTIYRGAGGSPLNAPALRSAASPLAFSPDSRYVAVLLQDTRSGLGAGNGRLDVIDLTTGTVSASAPGIVGGASFAPSGRDRVVFALAASQRSNAPQNLYEMPADGSTAPRQITHDGHSTAPLWGARGIVFVRFRSRGRNEAPAYRLALRRGRRVRLLRSPTPGPLVEGLSPVAISADGTHLLAEFIGEDTSQAYAVDLSRNRYHELRRGAQGGGISRDGRTVLISFGGFEGPSTHATIATEPFAGGRAQALIHGGDSPTWNR
jgi:hypothetical protein